MRANVLRVHGIDLVPEVRIVGETRLMHLRHDPNNQRRVSNAKDFGRVAVLLGGASTEREVSLLSAARTCSRPSRAAASMRTALIRPSAT